MLRKQTTQRGFTIIEVVITIAIGAAVMALVLNAVAGARRSQRNNARAADVNQVAAGVNQYIATRNQLPVQWTDIQQIIDPSKFGHYDKDVTNANDSINPALSVSGTVPAAGQFPTYTALGTAAANMIHFDEPSAADKIVVMRETGCTNTIDHEQGGIREMIILYKLEGQDNLVCLEI